MRTDGSARQLRSPAPSERLFGLAAMFDGPEEILAAAKAVRAAGYTRAEAYTPFPIVGLSEALGFRRTWVPPLVLAGGLCGAGGGFFMQWFANVVHLPWNVGGRPMNSWPAFIPITFEMGVLFAALCAVFGMLMLNRLPQPFHPLFKVDGFESASQDRFFLCIEAGDPKFDPEAVREFLRGLEPLAVMEVPK
jgi:hypothetical protein